MKIKTVSCIAPVGLSKTIENKIVDFELHEFGIIAKPKGPKSFNNRPRLVPWANVACCEIVTDEEELELAIKEEEAAKEVELPPAPAATTSEVVAKVEDTIVFSKDASGKVSEKRRSVFAEAAKAKVE